MRQPRIGPISIMARNGMIWHGFRIFRSTTEAGHPASLLRTGREHGAAMAASKKISQHQRANESDDLLFITKATKRSRRTRTVFKERSAGNREQGAGSRKQEESQIFEFLNSSIPQFIQLYHAGIWPCKTATRSGNQKRQ